MGILYLKVFIVNYFSKWFWAFCFFISFYYSNANSYVFGVHEYCHPETGQQVFLCLENHNLGLSWQNEVQREYFFDPILSTLSEQQVPSLLLVEAEFFYGLDLKSSDCFKNVMERFNRKCFPDGVGYLKYDLDNNPYVGTSSSWVMWQLCYCIARAYSAGPGEYSRYQIGNNIIVRSADPRMDRRFIELALWNNKEDIRRLFRSHITFRDLTGLCDSVLEMIENCVELNTDNYLILEVLNTLKRIIKRQKQLIADYCERYCSTSCADKTFAVALDEGLIEDDSLKRLFNILKTQNFFAEFVDASVICQILSEKDFRKVIVMTGATHCQNVACYLQQLGFESVYSYTYDLNDLENIENVVSGERVKRLDISLSRQARAELLRIVE
jgi:hypothetical protein